MEKLKNFIKSLSWYVKGIIPLLLALIILPITFQDQLQEKLDGTALGVWMEEKGFNWLQRVHQWDEQTGYQNILNLELDENGTPTDENSKFEVWLYYTLSGL